MTNTWEPEKIKQNSPGQGLVDSPMHWDLNSIRAKLGERDPLDEEGMGKSSERISGHSTPD